MNSSDGTSGWMIEAVAWVCALMFALIVITGAVTICRWLVSGSLVADAVRDTIGIIFAYFIGVTVYRWVRRS